MRSKPSLSPTSSRFRRAACCHTTPNNSTPLHSIPHHTTPHHTKQRHSRTAHHTTQHPPLHHTTPTTPHHTTATQSIPIVPIHTTKSYPFAEHLRNSAFRPPRRPWYKCSPQLVRPEGSCIHIRIRPVYAFGRGSLVFAATAASSGRAHHLLWISSHGQRPALPFASGGHGENCRVLNREALTGRALCRVPSPHICPSGWDPHLIPSRRPIHVS